MLGLGLQAGDFHFLLWAAADLIRNLFQRLYSEDLGILGTQSQLIQASGDIVNPRKLDHGSMVIM